MRQHHHTVISALTSDLFLVSSVCLYLLEGRPTHLLAGKQGIEDTVCIFPAELTQNRS